MSSIRVCIYIYTVLELMMVQLIYIYTVLELMMVQLRVFQLYNGVKGMVFSTKCTSSFGFWSFSGLTICGTKL